MHVNRLAELKEIQHKYMEMLKQKFESGSLPDKHISNYCAIFGSLPGENVRAKSDLVDEF